jgi:hypothetical protein
MRSAIHYRLLLWTFAIGAVLMAAKPAQADVRYYMLIFAAQTYPKIPRLSHTFCTIVKVVDPPPGCCAPYIEAHTISWLPATLKIKPYRLRAEPGRNLSLEETLQWADQHRVPVSEWGPYAIEECFYLRVYREYLRFESGEFLYRAIDSPRRGDPTSDCIHAVTDIDQTDPRRSFPVFRSGDAVTRKFVKTLRQRNRLMDPLEDVTWLNAVLGLDRYPVCHRFEPE